MGARWPSTTTPSTAALTGGPVAIGAIATVARRAQNGFVRSYALSLLGGALVVVLVLLAVNIA